MKNSQTKIFLVFSILLFLSEVFFYFHKDNSLDFFNEVGKTEIDKSFIFKYNKAEDYALNHLYKIDSVVANSNLTLSSKVKIYDYKKYFYEVNIKDYQTAHRYADSAFVLVRDQDPKKHKDDFAMAYLGKGDVYYSQNKFNEAFYFYYKARQFGLKYFDNCIKSDYSYRIGMIYYKQGFFEDARLNFSQALIEIGNCEDSFDKYYRKQEILSNIGLCYFHLKNYDSAGSYYDKALQYVQSNSSKYTNKKKSNEEAKGVIYGNIGNVYQEKGKLALAKEAYTKNVNINMMATYDIANAQLSYISLAELLISEKKMDSAFVALNKIKSSFDKVSTKKGEVEWNRVMWQYYVQEGNRVEAYKYLESFHNKKEQWLATDNADNQIDLADQYALFEDQRNAENLKADNSLKNLYLFITIFIAIVATAFLVFIWISWRTSKKNVSKLNKLIGTILTQNGELEFAFMSLSESTSGKEKLIKLVAHDLRTPLACMSMVTTLIEEEENETERSTLMTLMKDSCNTALELVDETLKSSSDPTSYELKRNIGINCFIIECIPLLEILALKKQIRVLTDLPENEILVNLDSGRFKRVINNLVVNAIKFSLPGSKIKISVTQENNVVIIAIKDQGVEIASDQLVSLFDGSDTFKRIGTSGEPSYGLGLSFCKHVVTEHNGHIRVNSLEGKGRTFYIQLPAAE
ncbi:MAG: tetratricopeptide repeat protein [Flavobacteriaceae bacterium]|nr:tetratricopeptide repeat protein [Flavobacteriaceae bacterium]